jgi:ketosteroid isomerase-like protein
MTRANENVELVRRALLASSGGDPTAALASFDAASEWDLTGVPGWPEKRVYRGLEEIRAFVQAWANSFETWRFDLEEVRDAGDGRVFATIHEWGVGAESGAHVDQYRYAVLDVRDGRIVRVDMFSDRADALHLAGLQE